MKKFLIISLVLLLGFSLAIGGCAINRKPAPPQKKNQGTETPAPSPSPDPTPSPSRKPAPTPTPARRPDMQADTQAAKLAKTAEKVDGVKSATVVITGSTAMVGLETDPDIEKEKTDKIKNKVAEQIKKTDNSIRNVSITTDPNLIARLDKIAQGIRNGKPISSFADELAEITRRMTPKTK